MYLDLHFILEVKMKNIESYDLVLEISGLFRSDCTQDDKIFEVDKNC
jgi:hypothetical protein